MPLKDLEALIGYEFTRAELLEQAITHKSFANENGDRRLQSVFPADNERLEFLGDAVLDLAISELLMARFPTDSEGSLSKKRASLVNEETLAQLATELGLTQIIRLGRGESKSGGPQKPRILASTLEAVFGAIQLDRGYAGASAVAAKIFESRISQFGQTSIDYHGDFKTRLQEVIQDTRRETPVYVLEKADGPDHEKTFEVSVRVNDESLAIGRGRSKKAAEQDAARQALAQQFTSAVDAEHLISSESISSNSSNSKDLDT